jgi:hypothetical protein
MLQAFNAFQCVVMFAALPHVIVWLASNPFPYSVAAFWTAILVYSVSFIGMVASVTYSFTEFR